MSHCGTNQGCSINLGNNLGIYNGKTNVQTNCYKQYMVCVCVCACLQAHTQLTQTGTHTTHTDRHTYTLTDWHIGM